MGEAVRPRLVIVPTEEDRRYAANATARIAGNAFESGSLGFGLSDLRTEGTILAFDPEGDGIALTSISHPQTQGWLTGVSRAAWFHARVNLADGLVWLAEKIGPFQYYERDK